MWFRTEREAARIRWRVITGKYNIQPEEESEKRATGKQKKENKNRNSNTVHMLGLND